MRIEVSSMGPFMIGWPVVDAWSSIQIKGGFAANSRALMVFSVLGERKKKILLTLRFADAVFGEDEAFGSSIRAKMKW
jgi:hypothetical protein